MHKAVKGNEFQTVILNRYYQQKGKAYEIFTLY